MQLNTVVLPAPFGPMMLWMLFASTSQIELGQRDQAAEAHGDLAGN